MSSTFAQSLRALDADRGRGTTLGLLAAVGLLAAWTLWFFRAGVSVHEASNDARIEVAQAAHSIDAPVAGRVVDTWIVLGREVQAGDVLLAIDADAERMRLAEEEARLGSVQPQLEALGRQLTSLTRSLTSERAATATALEQARAHSEDTRIAAAQADDEARRAGRLAAQGAISEVEGLRARALADSERAAAGSAALESGRLAAAQGARDMEAASREEELRRAMASLEGQRRVAVAAADVLRREIARRTIRAEIAGRIGQDSIVRPGEYVKEGQRLGEIVPPGRLRAVADFAPEAALGRIRPGQPARLRLDGFPWTQYGVVPATVTAVGGELHAGNVRVELELEPAPGSRIPLQHGLPGTVEIDVERATPAEIVFRASGRALGRPVAALRADAKP